MHEESAERPELAGEHDVEQYDIDIRLLDKIETTENKSNYT